MDNNNLLSAPFLPHIHNREQRQLLDAIAEKAYNVIDNVEELKSAKNETVSSNVTAGVSGRVKAVFAGAGDDVSTVMYEHGALALLSLDGKMMVTLSGGSYTQGQWQRLSITIDHGRVSVCDHEVAALHTAQNPERLSIRTGQYRDLPNRQTPNQDPAPPLPGCDERIQPALYLVDNVSIR